jgi:hypothetical protein
MKITMEVEVLEVGPGENVMILSSGFPGHKIAVATDCAYRLSSWYPEENQILQMRELDKRMKEDTDLPKIQEVLQNG